MKKEELWAIYTRKYPQFSQEGNITLSSKGLRKLFDTTWDTAYWDGEEEIQYSDPNPEGNLEKLKSIFGWQ